MARTKDDGLKNFFQTTMLLLCAGLVGCFVGGAFALKHQMDRSEQYAAANTDTAN